MKKYTISLTLPGWLLAIALTSIALDALGKYIFVPLLAWILLGGRP